MTVAPALVLGIGNPSRGDDAIGPTFLDRLAGRLAALGESRRFELLTDFQLQIEHSLDLVGRTHVFFIDASIDVIAPFRCERVFAKKEVSHTTHALSPEAVLATHLTLFGEPPPSWLFAIRGEEFELGSPLSDEASHNVDAALTFLLGELSTTVFGPAELDRPSGARLSPGG